MRTFEKSDQIEGNYLEYQVVSPLASLTFFQTKPLTVQLQQRLGIDEYHWLKNRIWSEEKDIASVNLTKSFQEVYGQKEVSSIQTIQATKKRKKTIDFRFIRSRLTSIIQPANWTAKLESELKQACYLFKLDEMALIKAIQNPEVSYGGYVNLEKLFHHLNTTSFVPSKQVTVQTVEPKPLKVEQIMTPKRKTFSTPRNDLTLRTFGTLSRRSSSPKKRDELNSITVDSLSVDFSSSKCVIRFCNA